MLVTVLVLMFAFMVPMAFQQARAQSAPSPQFCMVVTLTFTDSSTQNQSNCQQFAPASITSNANGKQISSVGATLTLTQLPTTGTFHYSASSIQLSVTTRQGLTASVPLNVLINDYTAKTNADGSITIASVTASDQTIESAIGLQPINYITNLRFWTGNNVAFAWTVNGADTIYAAPQSVLTTAITANSNGGTGGGGGGSGSGNGPTGTIYSRVILWYADGSHRTFLNNQLATFDSLFVPGDPGPSNPQCAPTCSNILSRIDYDLFMQVDQAGYTITSLNTPFSPCASCPNNFGVKVSGQSLTYSSGNTPQPNSITQIAVTPGGGGLYDLLSMQAKASDIQYLVNTFQQTAGNQNFYTGDILFNHNATAIVLKNAAGQTFNENTAPEQIDVNLIRTTVTGMPGPCTFWGTSGICSFFNSIGVDPTTAFAIVGIVSAGAGGAIYTLHKKK